MRKKARDVKLLEFIGEERIFDTAALDMQFSAFLDAFGVGGKAFEIWLAAQPHRRTKWADARIAARQRRQHGRTEEEAR